MVTVKFSGVALNPGVSDDVFCVDALGVPVGTPIYDFTRVDENNQPHKSRYQGPPSELSAALIEGELTEP